jgi:3',5'-cyclic AMP phosphodiesterase CpdA
VSAARDGAGRPSGAGRLRRACAAGLPVVALALALAGCARMGRLTYVRQPVAPVTPHGPHGTPPPEVAERQPLRPLFGDTLIGLQPGTGDSSIRFLGRLRDGYTADTLDLMIFGDNRPGYRWTRMANDWTNLRQMFSPDPVRIGRGLLAIPDMVWKSFWPDLGLFRDIPNRLRHTPTWGRQHQVQSAMLEQIDSLHARGRIVTAVINTGDLVEDGRYPANWERFLRLTYPLSSRVPYFAVAGNHERTDTPDGVANWRAATGLPVGSDRLYYCFDTADGWVRFIALDTNPIVDPGSHWSRDVQVKYSAEEFKWLVARVKEHTGPVIVMMHHPPFSAGFHRMEWQRDSVLSQRRETMVQALHEAGIAVISSGHEHAYERALLTWPDAVIVAVVSGGAGAPLHDIPSNAECARLFSEYHVAGSVVEPQNVFTSSTFHFMRLRLWFGGGELTTWAVDAHAKATRIDQVKIDLTRYGVPEIDQHKIPIPPAKGTKEHMKEMHKPTASADTTAASKRLLQSKPPIAVKTPRRARR